MIADVTSMPHRGELDDDALIEAGVDGDDRAVVSLLRRHDSLVRGVVWRIVSDRHVLDDVMQEAHLNVLRSLARFERNGEATFVTWFCQIAIRCAIDDRRKAQTRTAAMASVGRQSVPDEFERSDRRSLLREGLRRLDPTTAAAIALVDGEGMTQEQAAQVLSTDRDRVARRLRDGRRALRTYLITHGVHVQ